jgi:hypothetical protein
MEEACDNLNDAVDAYLETLKDEGELYSTLAERGFKPANDDKEKRTCDAPFLSSRHVTVFA